MMTQNKELIYVGINREPDDWEFCSELDWFLKFGECLIDNVVVKSIQKATRSNELIDILNTATKCLQAVQRFNVPQDVKSNIRQSQLHEDRIKKTEEYLERIDTLLNHVCMPMCCPFVMSFYVRFLCIFLFALFVVVNNFANVYARVMLLCDYMC